MGNADSLAPGQGRTGRDQLIALLRDNPSAMGRCLDAIGDALFVV